MIPAGAAQNGCIGLMPLGLSALGQAIVDSLDFVCREPCKR